MHQLGRDGHRHTILLKGPQQRERPSICNKRIRFSLRDLLRKPHRTMGAKAAHCPPGGNVTKTHQNRCVLLIPKLKKNNKRNRRRIVTTRVFLANIFTGSEIPACSSWVFVTTSRKDGYMKPPFTFGNHPKVYAVVTYL